MFVFWFLFVCLFYFFYHVCHLLSYFSVIVDSWASGTINQINTSFYKLPWSYYFITATNTLTSRIDMDSHCERYFYLCAKLWGDVEVFKGDIGSHPSPQGSGNEYFFFTCKNKSYIVYAKKWLEDKQIQATDRSTLTTALGKCTSHIHAQLYTFGFLGLV